MRPKRKAKISDVSTESSDPEVDDELPPDKFIVCVDRINQTPVIGKKNMKTGIFTPCANFSLEILRFCDGVNFAAPSYKIQVYLTSEPQASIVLIPDNVDNKKQLTKAITTSLSAPTYCQLSKNEFTNYFGDIVSSFVRKGLPKEFLVGYSGWQIEGLKIEDLKNTLFCVLSEKITIGYDGNPTTNHHYIFSPEIVNKYMRKKENKLDMLRPIRLEVTSVEESKEQFKKLFDVGPEGAGAESFKLLMVSYQAQQAAPIVKKVKSLDSTPMICQFGEHGAAKTTSNKILMWAYSDMQLQFNCTTPSATHEVLSTSTCFTLYLDDVNNLDKEEKFTAPFYDEKGSATQTGGFSKPRAKLVWSTNVFGKRSRKVAGRSVMIRLQAWLNELDPVSRVKKINALKDLIEDDRRPLQFTLSQCQKAATDEFLEMYLKELQFVDENFPPGLDPREKSLWGQLLTWFEVYSEMFPEYFNREVFNQHLYDVVIPDIHMWNPSAGPSLTLDEFICAGVDELMKTPDAHYRVLRAIRLGKRDVYISRPSFPHVQKISIEDYDDVVKKIGGVANNTQKFLRPDCIASKLVITKTSAACNASSHRSSDIPQSSLEESTLEKIKEALDQKNIDPSNPVGYSPAKDDIKDTIADLTTKLRKLKAEKLLMAKRDFDGASSSVDVDSQPTTSDEESDVDFFSYSDEHYSTIDDDLLADQASSVDFLRDDDHGRTMIDDVHQLAAKASPADLKGQEKETAEGEAPSHDVEPKAAVEPEPSKPKAAVEPEPSKPKAAVEPEPSKPKAAVEPEPSKPKAAVEPEPSKPKAAVEPEPSKPNTAVELEPSKPEAAVEPQPFKMEECKVCSEPGPLVQFEPCGHTEVCNECAVRIKKCLNCKIFVSQKILKTGTNAKKVSLVKAANEKKIILDKPANEKKVSLDKPALQKKLTASDGTLKKNAAVFGSKDGEMDKISSIKKRKQPPSDSPLNSQNMEEKLSPAIATSNKKIIAGNNKIKDKIVVASTSSATKMKNLLTKSNTAHSRGKAIVSIASKQKEIANETSKRKETVNEDSKRKETVNEDSKRKETVNVSYKTKGILNVASKQKENLNVASKRKEMVNAASNQKQFNVPSNKKKNDQVGSTKKENVIVAVNETKNVSDRKENANKTFCQKDKGSIVSNQEVARSASTAPIKAKFAVPTAPVKLRNVAKGKRSLSSDGETIARPIESNKMKVQNRKRSLTMDDSVQKNIPSVAKPQLNLVTDRTENANKASCQNEKSDTTNREKSHRRSLSSGGETIARPFENNETNVQFRKRSLTMDEMSKKDIMSSAKEEPRRSVRKKK